MDKPRERKVFAYVKTEVRPQDIKRGMLYSLEPADETDNGCHPDELFFAITDAEDSEHGFRTRCHRLVRDPQWGLPEAAEAISQAIENQQ